MRAKKNEKEEEEKVVLACRICKLNYLLLIYVRNIYGHADSIQRDTGIMTETDRERGEGREAGRQGGREGGRE